VRGKLNGMLRPALLSLALLLPASSAAHADDASKLAKAHEYFALTHTEQISQQMMDQLTGQANRALLQGLTGAAPTPNQQRVIDQTQAQMRGVLERTIGFHVLEPEYARLIVGLYTEEQLDQLITFYRSPAGQALVEKTPLLLQQSTALVQERVATAAPELQELLRQAMEQLLHSTAPAAPAEKAPEH
jgi:uncharacterized protein